MSGDNASTEGKVKVGGAWVANNSPMVFAGPAPIKGADGNPSSGNIYQDFRDRVAAEKSASNSAEKS